MASLNYPYTFTNGTTADANQVMSDLNAVKTFVEGSVVQADGSVQAPTAAIANSAVTYAKLANDAKPGLVLLSSTLVSGQTSVNIDNVFNLNYDTYKIVFSRFFVSSAANTYFQFRFNASGTPDTGSNYRYTYRYSEDDGGGVGNQASNSSTMLPLCQAYGVGSEVFFTLEINNPCGSGVTRGTMDSVGYLGIYDKEVSRNGSIRHNHPGNPQDGFHLYLSNSFGGAAITSVTMTGRIAVYGYKY